MSNKPAPGKKSAQNASRKQKAQAAAPSTGVSRTLIGVVIGVVAVVAIGVAIALAVGGGDDEPSGSTTGAATSTATLPAGAIEGGKGIVVNEAVAKAGAPTLEIYFDFQCPYCGELESQHGDQIQTWAQDGTVKLVLHPKTFLDTNLKNDASMRAARGFACAAEAGKGIEYYTIVFKNQPAHEGEGWTNAQLEQFASDAGLSGDALSAWKTCYSSGQFTSYLEAVETQSQKDGVFSTPTVKLDGTDLDLQQVFGDPTYLEQQIAAATK